MEMFLFYVVLSFTKHDKKEIGRDTIHDKLVPTMLYIQNIQLLKDYYTTQIEKGSQEYEEKRARAQ